MTENESTQASPDEGELDVEKITAEQLQEEDSGQDSAEDSRELSTEEHLRTQLDESQDRALRAQAELDNYRKRSQREMREDRKYSNIHLLRDLLPVLDNVHRAIEAAEKSSDAAGLLEGFKLVAQQLETVLGQYHCKQIEAHDQPFDPNWHEAIMQQPSDEHPENTVIGVTQLGYQLHDRVVRPAQVIVAKKPESE